jgi:hypothetical protein
MNRAEYIRGYRQRMGVTDKRNTCIVCGSAFTARRGAKTCSSGCRQKFYRERVTDVGPVRAKPEEDKTMTEGNSMTKRERTELGTCRGSAPKSPRMRLKATRSGF